MICLLEQLEEQVEYVQLCSCRRRVVVVLMDWLVRQVLLGLALEPELKLIGMNRGAVQSGKICLESFM